MAKYDVFIAKTSDGKNEVKCRTIQQAKKFLHPWLLEVHPRSGFVVEKLDEHGAPLVGIIEHVHEEIEVEEHAGKRGLTAAKANAKPGAIRRFKMKQENRETWVLVDAVTGK